jgi:hypothetical protein
MFENNIVAMNWYCVNVMRRNHFILNARVEKSLSPIMYFH